MSDKYISVGKIRKPHGIHGAFSFSFTLELKSFKKAPDFLFIKIGEQYIPHFIESLELSNWQDGYIKFEEYNNPETGRVISAQEMFCEPAEIATFFKKQKDDYAFLIGFLAVDETVGEIGLITEILDLPGQTLAQIDHDGDEVLIPLVDDLVLDVNKRKKMIVFQLPEGFLGI